MYKQRHGAGRITDASKGSSTGIGNATPEKKENTSAAVSGYKLNDDATARTVGDGEVQVGC